MARRKRGGDNMDVEDDSTRNEEEEEDSSSSGSGSSDSDNDSDSGDEGKGSMDVDSQIDGSKGKQIRVKFTTKHDEFRVTETSITVPIQLGRSGLSQVINHLLALDPPMPFDFLVVEKQTLVRGKLHQIIDELELSTEKVLELEYAPTVQEPELNAEDKWPDWIACVDARYKHSSGKEIIAGGCYDGSIHFSCLNGKTLEPVGKFNSHRCAVKAIRQFGNRSNRGERFVASCAKDGLVKLFSSETSQNESKLEMKLNQIAVCSGHTGSVEALDAISIGNFAVIGSGGWDKSVQLWKIRLDEKEEPEKEEEEEEEEEDEQPRSAKSRKLQNGKGTKSKRNTLKTYDAPAVAFCEHKDNVSAICWESGSSPSILFSGSFDHTIRGWDVTRECNTLQLTGNKVVTGLSHSSLNGKLLASSHADNSVRLWDARTTGDAIVKLRLKSHQGWVSSVAWDPVHPNLLVSGSHDKTIKVWDIRTTVPLHTLSAHTSKILAVDLSEDGSTIASGGADSIIRSHNMKH